MPNLVDQTPMSGIIREFVVYKSAIQGCSEKTVSEYILDLRTFFRYIHAKRNGIAMESEAFEAIDLRVATLEYVESVTTEEIYEFLMYAGTVRGNMWSARSRKLSAIKALYKYLVTKRKLFDTNPAVDIESPKAKKSLPKFLTLEESVRLLEAVRNDKDSKTVDRDYAIITLFLNCGMRVSELVGINLVDMDKELRSLRVIGKGSKERVIYLNDACREALRTYLTLRLDEEHRNLRTGALFISNRNQRISVKTVQWLVYKYLDLAGLEAKHYSVHKLRHTAATLMYQSGNVDVRVLKDILGHEQLNTTQIYTHVSNESMEKAMQQNPLAKQKIKENDE